MLWEFLERTGPELVVVFVQGSGAKRPRCWLIDMQAELPSLRCGLLYKSASHSHREYVNTHT